MSLSPLGIPFPPKHPQAIILVEAEKPLSFTFELKKKGFHRGWNEIMPPFRVEPSQPNVALFRLSYLEMKATVGREILPRLIDDLPGCQISSSQGGQNSHDSNGYKYNGEPYQPAPLPQRRGKFRFHRAVTVGLIAFHG